MADLLLELFSEEIPARMQDDAAQTLANLFKEAMKKTGFADCAAKTFVTPRRLALLVSNIPAAQPDVSAELKGPKVDAPQAAIDGFLKKSNLTLAQLENRGGVYFANIHQKGKPTAEILKPLIEGILQNFPWPKSMRWGAGDVTWVRPLHSILCIFDGKVVPVEFGTVKANNITYGHRFLAPAAITINTPADYESALQKACVIADREKRKAEIVKQAEKIAGNLSIKKDDALLEEVTGLVEWPVALMGSIDAKFMDLPPEVLTTVMKKHQKYFSLVEKDGKLSSHFLIIANTDKGSKNVIAGNERVLRARFSDARFFWDTDRKKPLSDWATSLKDVTFHAKLGSIADKVERIKAIAVALTEYVPGADKKLVERAAELCKADLVTGMVGEFAELQGIMGRYYALQEKVPSGVTPALWTEIAYAIQEHYKPQGPNDSVPNAPISICLALADKLDTLFSMRSMDETSPTGSKDPYAVRRAMLGFNRIIQERELKIPLRFLPEKIFGAATQAKFDTIQNNYIHRLKIKDSGKIVFVTIGNDFLGFATDRLKVQLKDQNIRHDVINAVIADGDDDLVRVVGRAKALQEFLSRANGINMLAAYKRAANIVGIEEKKDKVTYSAEKLNPALLQEKEEKELSSLLGATANILKDLRVKEQFTDMMEELATLRAPIDHFFDKIMVNCENKELRIERLRLLARIRDFMDTIADFSLIEGDVKEQKKAA